MFNTINSDLIDIFINHQILSINDLTNLENPTVHKKETLSFSASSLNVSFDHDGYLYVRIYSTSSASYLRIDIYDGTGHGISDAVFKPSSQYSSKLIFFRKGALIILSTDLSSAPSNIDVQKSYWY